MVGSDESFFGGQNGQGREIRQRSPSNRRQKQIKRQEKLKARSRWSLKKTEAATRDFGKQTGGKDVYVNVDMNVGIDINISVNRRCKYNYRYIDINKNIDI